MADKQIILGKLNPFGNQKNLIKRNQQVPDIISAMLKAHELYAVEYDKIAPDFYTGDAVGTARKIFNFLKQNVRYKIDSENNQQIMSPSGILSIGKNDCKNYALFIVGVLDALKRRGLIKNDVFYRFASYRMFDEVPHHVFAVLIDNKGNEVYIDPVLSRFNERKNYFHKIDKRPKMAIYSISGIGRVKSRTAPVQPTATATAPAKKPKKRIVLKVALAPARGALLLLIGLNFAGLATKLDRAFKNNAGKTKDWWLKLGGNPNKLLSAVNKGARKRRIFGDDEMASEGQVGAVATTAAAATAAPILIKLAEFLKSIGIDAKDVAESGKKLLAQKVKKEVDKRLDREETAAQITQDRVNQMVDDARQPAAGKNYLPILIGGGVVAYLLTRKK